METFHTIDGYIYYSKEVSGSTVSYVQFLKELKDHFLNGYFILKNTAFWGFVWLVRSQQTIQRVNRDFKLVLSTTK